MTSLTNLLASQNAEVDQLNTPQSFNSGVGLPSYLVAADNHSIANNSQSFLESAAETISSIPKFLGLSVVSGVNQLYNIAPTLGNYAGGDFELSKTADVINALDEDLGKYYEDHQESIDVGGFLLSSLVPGLAGIKVLNMGQKALSTMKVTGRLGAGMREATGLGKTLRQTYLDKAIKEVSSTNSLSLLTNTNTMKAMAAGYGQAVLETAAFETSTAIALSSSPVLENQDVGDIATNIAVFGLAFGTIGGVFNVTKSVFAVKSAKAAAEKVKAPFVEVLQLHESAPPANKVAYSVEQLNRNNNIDKQVYDDAVALSNKETVDRGITAQNQFYDNIIRENLTRLAGDDKELGAAAYMMLVGKGAEGAADDYKGAIKFSRITDLSKEEKVLKDIQKKVAAGKVEIGSKEAQLLDESTLESAYINVWGEPATLGGSTHSVPAYTSLSDTLRASKKNPITGKHSKGESIVIDQGGVSAGSQRFNFTIGNAKLARTNTRKAGFKTAVDKDKAGSGYNILDHSAHENEARVMWSIKLKPFLSEAEKAAKLKDPQRNIGVVIDDTDIALLEKMYREYHPDHRVKTSDGEIISFPVKSDLYRFILEQKSTMANKFLANAIESKKLTTVQNSVLKDGKITRVTETTESKVPAVNNLTQQEIAASINVTPGWLNAEIRTVDYDRSLFALQGYAADYAELQVGRGTNTVVVGNKLKTLTASELVDEAPVYLQPKTIKATYDTSLYKDTDGMILDGIAAIQQQERLLAQRVQNVQANYFGEDFSKFIDLSNDVMLDADRLGAVQQATTLGAGGKFLTAASGNYGSLASLVEFIGKTTAKVMEKKRDAMNELLNPATVKLAGSKAATIEWSTANANLRAFGSQKYVLNEAGDGLVRKEIALWERQAADGVEGIGTEPPRSLVDGAPDHYPANADGSPKPFDNAETIGMVKSHIDVNGRRVAAKNELRRAQGMEDKVEPDEFYPIPVNPKDVPFFAFVIDDSITGTGHSRMVYAKTEADLETELNKLASKDPVDGTKWLSRDDNLTVLTKKEAEDYHRSFGQFDQTRTLGDNYIDSALSRNGVSSPVFVTTDPAKVAAETHAFHATNETSLVREMVESRYEKEFEYLRQRGRDFTNLSTSKFNKTASLRHAEDVVKNPFMDYIRTSLNVKNYADYPFWVNANLQLEKKVTDLFDKISKVFYNTKSVEELDEINKLLKKSGYKGAAYDNEMDIIVNHIAPKAVLQNFVQKSNAILATTILRLDALNAVNNAISFNILYGAEIKSVMRVIERDGGESAIGELSALKNLKVPGTDKSIFSAHKMYANAVRDFGRENPTMTNAFAKEHGFITTISDQYKSVVDTLSLTGTESAKELTGKLSKARDIILKGVDKGERWTGNRLAEEFNRFVAAHTMKQMTDIAVKHGAMDSKTALAYINTFVNRVNGNYLASQRPMLFQGAIGQSIGLFQTYQFNLMQQLLRHVGEGTSKDTATLIGLQGTIFGLNGLPAFNAINTHIIGTASGNDKHKDAYTTVYGAAGKDAGDWLMYGFASNMLLHPDLKTNLYVRGDINPRNVTIVPVDPRNIPIVQAAGKFFSNIFDTASKINQGADFGTALLQGLEHNAISRPLAGIAQTLQGLTNPQHQSFSTSRRGNVIGSNDILSLVNMGRILGGKPLGEAIATDAAYRIKAYSLSDSRKRNDLGSAIKTTIIAGKHPEQSQIDDFAFQYAALGGKSEEFNSWMMQLYTTANTSQANTIRRALKSPFSKNMQLIMGGYELNDFTN